MCNYYKSLIDQRMTRMIIESSNCIDLLYATPCMQTRNMLLYRLKSIMCEIDFLYCMSSALQQQKILNTAQAQTQGQDEKQFTLDELARYDGRNGNPAYVAVNGVVYDVTNNAGWAAATHFGLTAGNDLTGEFASCHAGQNILARLPVVGKLI